MIRTILLTSAAVIQLASAIPYLHDIFQHKTKPERGAYWIFSLLTGITLITQLADGGGPAVVLTALWTVYGLALALLSIKYGYGQFKKRDVISIFIALTGVGLWLVTKQPLLSVIIIILVDMAGFWLILVKSWHAPYTETFIAWVASAVSATLVLIAVGKFEAVQIGYILYSAIACWAIVFLLIYRRRVLAPTNK